MGDAQRLLRIEEEAPLKHQKIVFRGMLPQLRVEKPVEKEH